MPDNKSESSPTKAVLEPTNTNLTAILTTWIKTPAIGPNEKPPINAGTSHILISQKGKNIGNGNFTKQ